MNEVLILLCGICSHIVIYLLTISCYSLCKISIVYHTLIKDLLGAAKTLLFVKCIMKIFCYNITLSKLRFCYNLRIIHSINSLWFLCIVITNVNNGVP